MQVTNNPKEAVELIAKEINSLLGKQENVTMAFPGGRSITKIFSALKKAEIPWNRIHIFMIDERLVPIENKDSNFRMVDKELLSGLVDLCGLLPQNIHPFIMDEDMPDYGIKEYEINLRMIKEQYDIIFLGVGEDGHVGALFPKLTIKDESDYFLITYDSPKPPKNRMTASRKLLQKAKMAVVLFFGEDKREAYENFKKSSIPVEKCPAKLAQKIKKLIVVTDLEE
ncbi:MAG: 6-phosphogluconolactonase [Nanoarchaeota archaeon]